MLCGGLSEVPPAFSPRPWQAASPRDTRGFLRGTTTLWWAQLSLLPGQKGGSALGWVGKGRGMFWGWFHHFLRHQEPLLGIPAPNFSPVGVRGETGERAALPLSSLLDSSCSSLVLTGVPGLVVKRFTRHC